MSTTKPYPLKNTWIQASPFKNKESVLAAEKKYASGHSIGFTALASLRSMGRVKRSNGMYSVGPKYTAIS